MPAIAPHHTATEDSAWDGPAAVAAMPNEYADLHYCHGWWTPEAASSSHTAGDDDADDKKGAYSFPHHRKEGGPANVPACRNALARVANSSIPAGDKAGVRKHAQTHLDDANKKSGNSARLLLPAGVQASMRRIYNLNPPTGRKWYRFTNDAGSGAESTLYIFGPIGSWFGVNSEDFVEDLAQITGPLNVHINSGGGDAFEGINIANLLRNHPSTVNGVVTGLAASAASIIAMGCDSLTMSPGSQLMIHRAMTGAYGNRSDFAEVMDDLGRMDTSLAVLYQLRAGGDLADWETAMQAETWYTPQEAVDAGLADHIAEPPDKAGDAEPAWGNRAEPVVVAAVEPVVEPVEPAEPAIPEAPVPAPPSSPSPVEPAPAQQTPVGGPPRAAADLPPDPTPVDTAPPRLAIDPNVVRAAISSAFSNQKEARR